MHEDLTYPSPRRVDVARALRRHWPVVLLIAAAAVGAGVFATSRKAPEYEAAARLIVLPLRQDDTSLWGTDLIRDAGDAAETTSTVAAVLETEAAAKETARRLGGDWTTDSVLKAIEITPEENASVIDVTGTASEPRAAAAVATEFSNSVIRLRRRVIVRQLAGRYDGLAERRNKVSEDDYSQRDRLFTEMRLIEKTLQDPGDPTLRVVQAATPPRTAKEQSRAFAIGFALLGGLGLGLAAAIALDFVRRPARAESAERDLARA